MRSKFALLMLATALAGCSYKPHADLADRGVEPVNTPVVTRADYVFDAAAPGGSLAPAEKARLDAWFSYGMMLQPGAPVTAGAVAPGSVRVIVSRTRAEVPGCPNWSQPSQPNYNNQTMSNFGCAVNSNLAMQVANPEDLLNGRESGLGSTAAGTKAVMLYKSAPPTGSKGLQDVSVKGGK